MGLRRGALLGAVLALDHYLPRDGRKWPSFYKPFKAMLWGAIPGSSCATPPRTMGYLRRMFDATVEPEALLAELFDFFGEEG